MESRKMVQMNLFAGQQWKHRQRRQTCGHREWNKWRGGTSGESSMDTYILTCKIDASGNLLYDSGGQTSAVRT